ncbi:MAG: hypothetical protein IJ326_02055 [Lachnospiraceae bacterium]|nr:hypothetical protein [Lachnospiraceae bacterium]
MIVYSGGARGVDTISEKTAIELGSAVVSFVVASDYNEGGTWAGATEALRNEWTKVLVWEHPDYNGNLKLIEKGAKPYSLSDEKIYDIITRKENVYEQIDFFNMKNSALVCEDKAGYYANDKAEV